MAEKPTDPLTHPTLQSVWKYAQDFVGKLTNDADRMRCEFEVLRALRVVDAAFKRQNKGKK